MVTFSCRSICTLTLGPNNTMKKSVLRVAAKASESSRELYRDIYVRVIGPTDIESATATYSGLTKGSTVTVNLTLPQDLGRSLFPMTLFFEADDNSLSAVTEDISVERGTSKFNGKNTFYFVKTIAYSDYYEDGYKTLDPFVFEFNKAVTAAPNIKVWDADNFLHTRAASQLISPLILINGLGVRQGYCSHFTDKETELREVECFA